MKILLITLSLTTSVNLFAQQFKTPSHKSSLPIQFMNDGLREELRKDADTFRTVTPQYTTPAFNVDNIKVVTIPAASINVIELQDGDFLTPDELVVAQPKNDYFQYQEQFDILQFKVIDGKTTAKTVQLNNGQMIDIMKAAMGGDMGGGGAGNR